MSSDFTKNAIRLEKANRVELPRTATEIKIYFDGYKLLVVDFRGKVTELTAPVVSEGSPIDLEPLQEAITAIKEELQASIKETRIDVEAVRNEIPQDFITQKDLQEVILVNAEAHKLIVADTKESIAAIKEALSDLESTIERVDKKTDKKLSVAVFDELQSQINVLEKALSTTTSSTLEEIVALQKLIDVIETKIVDIVYKNDIIDYQPQIDTISQALEALTKTLLTTISKSEAQELISTSIKEAIPVEKKLEVRSVTTGDKEAFTIELIGDTYYFDIVFPITRISGGGSGGVRRLSELKDVSITNPQVNDVIQWNGSKWENGTLSVNISGGITTINEADPDATGNFTIDSDGSIEVITDPITHKVTLSLYSAITGSLTIDSIDISGGGTISPSVAEIGMTVNETDLSWTLSKTEVSQSLNNSIGAITVGDRSYTHVDSYSTNRTYTLSFSDGTTNSNASASIAFRSRSFWGLVADRTNLLEADIEAATNELSTSRSKAITFNPSGNHIFFAYPKSYGLATVKDENGFTVESWNNGGTEQTTPYEVSITNAYGYTQDYYVYHSYFVYNASLITLSWS